MSQFGLNPPVKVWNQHEPSLNQSIIALIELRCDYGLSIKKKKERLVGQESA